MSSNVTETGGLSLLEYWLRIYGSTWLMDGLYFYLLTPISLVSVIFNLLTYLILKRSSFGSGVIFNYLRAYTINSALLSVLLTTTFICTTYRIFEFTNTYGAYFFGSYFHSPFLSIFYFNGNLLELCIIMERIIILNKIKHVKNVLQFKYFKLILFLSSVVINLSVFFLNYPGYDEVELENHKKFRIYYWTVTEFSASTAGRVISYVTYFFRDILSLVVKIVLNIFSVYLIRKYFNKIKQDKMVNLPESVISSSKLTNDTYLNNQFSITNAKSYLSEVDRNLTYIAIVVCVLSSLENVFFITSYVYVVICFDETSFILWFFSYFSIAIKHFSNFIVLFLFNNLFREEFKKSFSCL